MDRPTLENLLSQGLSLAEIGRRFERHESTVAYWVQNYGLAAANRDAHAAKGGLGREELESLVREGMSIGDIAQRFGRGKATVRYWLGRYGLRTSGHAGAPARDGTAEARRAGLMRATILCPRHGTTEHVQERRGYYRCCKCRQEAVIERRRKVKRLLVSELGGRCRLCGYDRCSAALEFHHIDPSEKDFGLASHGARSIASLRAEASKCILLCSNCHAEVESGFSSVAA